MKILVVEDELSLQKAIVKGLRKFGYAVDSVSDGEQALYFVSVNFYDLIVLDLNLPELDGIEVLKEVRKVNQEIKVLILSARSEVENKIEGLDLGANDFLSKPFHFNELEARIRALLRRKFIQQDCIISFYGLSLDTVKKVVLHGNEKVSLTKKEYSILEYLIMHRGAVISAEKLIEHIWESDADLFSNSFKVQINSLRKKLFEKTNSNSIIQNSRGMGYFIAEESK